MATVLVVDDEYGVAELFEAILTDEGHRVLTAMDGKHGLELLARERPGLVFLDFMMPVMNGAAVLRALSADPALKNTRVVVMSSMAVETVAEQCSGYMAIMHKPFRLIEVVDLAERLLGKGSNRAA